MAQVSVGGSRLGCVRGFRRRTRGRL